MENPTKMDDLGIPLFLETPNKCPLNAEFLIVLEVDDFFLLEVGKLVFAEENH